MFNVWATVEGYTLYNDSTSADGAKIATHERGDAPARVRRDTHDSAGFFQWPYT